MALLDGFNIDNLLQSVQGRRPPGRPKRIPPALVADEPLSQRSRQYYSVSNLTEMFVRAPSMCHNWRLQKAFDVKRRNGTHVTAIVVGTVRYWFRDHGANYWNVLFANNRNEDLSVETLAQAIHNAAIDGVNVAGPAARREGRHEE